MPQQEICPTCNGSGSVGSPPEECPTCSGNGRVPDVAKCPTCLGVKYVGEDPCPTCFMQGSTPLDCIYAETFKRVDGVDSRTKVLMLTYKIFEATIKADYDALTDTQKDRYRRILSCVFVDWTLGTRVRDKLSNMFAGTDTIIAIDALEV